MKHLELSFGAGVATVTLNRPDVRNAFNDEFIAEMTAVFLELAKRDEVRCVVIAGSGPAFCAGADLNWMKSVAGYTREQNVEDAMGLARMLEGLYRFPKPTVARVHGDVYAGGVGLVAACDIVVSVDSAQYCLSEVRLGLIPATISPYVIRAMGARAAHRYFLTAERFGAPEAQRIGLAHEVVPADALDGKVADIARALVAAGPEALKACKQLLHDVAGHEIGAGLIRRTVETIADLRASDEGREGIQSFLGKRKPAWVQGQ
ncbi:MAG: enoyl-CoA hydratase/isomerase family protein [Comamonadaceae bacterium]|nr:MAG: enoyl-CoA hydratase/isomerase family protein [Comamonadaceae bacterium]